MVTLHLWSTSYFSEFPATHLLFIRLLGGGGHCRSEQALRLPGAGLEIRPPNSYMSALSTPVSALRESVGSRPWLTIGITVAASPIFQCLPVLLLTPLKSESRGSGGGGGGRILGISIFKAAFGKTPAQPELETRATSSNSPSSFPGHPAFFLALAIRYWPWPICPSCLLPPPTPLGAATQVQPPKQKSPGGPERRCE